MSTQTIGHDLILGLDLSVLSSPLSVPSKESPHVLVIGGGVTGLNTSWLLLDKGYRVTIVSSSWASTCEEGQGGYVLQVFQSVRSRKILTNLATVHE